MKIALCLSGQLRFLQEGYREMILPFILDGNDIDVFVHTWNIDDDQDGKSYINGGGFPMGNPVNKGIMLEIFDLYKPVKCLIQKQVPFQNGKYPERTLPGIKSHNLFSMFYSVYKSNQLKKEYEKENNFKYDIVVRSRFDIKLDKKIDFLIDTSKVYIPFNCFDTSNGYVDSISYSNSKYMDIYADTFNNIDRIMETHNIGFCGEYILRKQLDSYNLPIETTFWHSLYR